jgi:16S rRNA processing protein RimM
VAAPAGRLVVAELGRPHGIRGEVTGRLHGVGPEELVALRELTLRPPEGPEEPVRVERVRPRKLGWILQLAGVSTRNRAEELRGAEILAPRGALPEPAEGEWLVADLVGRAVETEEGELLGRLEEVLLLPANDVLVVRGERGEILLPVLPEVLVRCEEGEERLVVRVPPGLLDEPGGA